jgi:hypothetical protein
MATYTIGDGDTEGGGNSPPASTTVPGLIAIATGAEALAGVVPNKAITPATLALVLGDFSGGSGGDGGAAASAAAAAQSAQEATAAASAASASAGAASGAANTAAAANSAAATAASAAQEAQAQAGASETNADNAATAAANSATAAAQSAATAATEAATAAAEAAAPAAAAAATVAVNTALVPVNQAIDLKLGIADAATTYVQTWNGNCHIYNESDGGSMSYLNADKTKELAGICLNGACPQLFVHRYDTSNALTNRVLLEIHDDGAYLSTALTGTAWLRLVTTDDLTAALADAGAGFFHFRGTVATVADLPDTGNLDGDLYKVTADNSEHYWLGSEWEPFGATVDLSPYLLATTAASTYATLSALAAKLDSTAFTYANLGGKPAAFPTTWENVSGKPTLANVATSGDYNDLTNKPIIPPPYTLPVATYEEVGGVKLPAAGSGLNATASSGSFELACATSNFLGGLKIGAGLSQNSAQDGTVDVAPATTTSIGGIKVGDGLNITSDGILSVTGGGGGGTSTGSQNFTELPLAQPYGNASNASWIFLDGDYTSIKAGTLLLLNFETGEELVAKLRFDFYISQDENGKDYSYAEILQTYAYNNSYSDELYAVQSPSSNIVRARLIVPQRNSVGTFINAISWKVKNGTFNGNAYLYQGNTYQVTVRGDATVIPVNSIIQHVDQDGIGWYEYAPNAPIRPNISSLLISSYFSIGYNETTLYLQCLQGGNVNDSFFNLDHTSGIKVTSLALAPSAPVDPYYGIASGNTIALSNLYNALKQNPHYKLTEVSLDAYSSMTIDLGGGIYTLSVSNGSVNFYCSQSDKQGRFSTEVIPINGDGYGTTYARYAEILNTPMSHTYTPPTGTPSIVRADATVFTPYQTSENFVVKMSVDLKIDSVGNVTVDFGTIEATKAYN